MTHCPLPLDFRLAESRMPTTVRDLDILYLHLPALPGPAANTVQVAKTCDAFARLGVATRLVQPSAECAAPAEIANFYGLSQPIAVLPSFAPRIPGRRLIFGFSACLRHATQARTVVYTRDISMARAAVVYGTRVVLEMHGPIWADKPRDARRFQSLSGHPLFLGLVAISQSIADWFQAKFPSLRGRIVVARDAADPIAETEPVELSGSFRVGYCGHLYPGKGMELISQLAPRCREATFHVVGGRAAEISHWSARLAGSGNVIFHGHRPHSDMPRYIASMDVVLAPYQRVVRGDGGADRNLSDWMSPLKLFEYMAAGKPILCSDLKVLREVLTDGQNARLADPDNPEAWAALLKELQRDPGQRKRLAKRARNDFLESYTWDKRAERILTAISAFRAAGRRAAA